MPHGKVLDGFPPNVGPLGSLATGTGKFLDGHAFHGYEINLHGEDGAKGLLKNPPLIFPTKIKRNRNQSLSNSIHFKKKSCQSYLSTAQYQSNSNKKQISIQKKNCPNLVPGHPGYPIPIQEAQNLHPLNVSAGNAQHGSHLLPSQAGVDHEDGHREDVEERPHGIFEDLELQGLRKSWIMTH